ncbi:hypothetical protein [Alkaliphilus hydrothermalis]|uniref:Uncharacterized protein n=1 Tax=Alkaliphilus hydrothermalis TaxID=1482730 RepID=A0ABS2NNP3_9FIRM|nr:hypothetical protein [Alkaliphilus hydrothermalis]MBM7614447.1 hypothetical protein [Alkaliphilus hydrothermalis]
MIHIQLEEKIKCLEDLYVYIDQEVNQYFSSVEKMILKSLQKKNQLYNLDIVTTIQQVVFNDNEFKNMINSIKDRIGSVASYYRIAKPIELNISDEEIGILTTNTALLKEYKKTYQMALQTEAHLDDVFNDSLALIFPRKYEKVLEERNFSMGKGLLSLLRLSSQELSIRHQKEFSKRIAGILLNIKLRTKKQLKNQCNDFLMTQSYSKAAS